MMRHLSLGLALLLTYLGCSGDPEESTATGTGGSSTGSGCSGEVDGLCDVEQEGCDCADCQDTAYCEEDLCTIDGSCDGLLDSCTCSDCDGDFFCADPGDYNCLDDGTCDSFVEGCNCEDCFDKPDCLDNVAACDGGAPDGSCDAPGESCSCPDCLGTSSCVPCVMDGSCDVSDPCWCKDCSSTEFCQDPDGCLDDGICAPLYEGCVCSDCADLTECE